MPEACLQEPGVLKTDIRWLAPYEQLRLQDRFDVYLIQDSQQAGKAVITAPTNLLHGIVTKSENNRLVLRNNNKCRWLREMNKRIKVELFVANLSSIISDDGCALICADSLYFKNLKVEQRSTFNLQLKGRIGTLELASFEAGEVTLSGYSAVLILTNYETGAINAQEMLSDFTYVFHYGLNKCEVKPAIELEAYIGNKGNVYYHQIPSAELLRSGNGSGSLIRK